MTKQPTILSISLGIVAGAAVASFFPWWISCGVAFAVIAFPGGGWITAGIILITLRFVTTPLEASPRNISERAGEIIQTKGTVSSVVSREHGKVKLIVDVDADGKEGRVLLNSRTDTPLRPGDRLTVRGKLEKPVRFATFDYRAYLAKDGIHSVMRTARISSVEPRRSLSGTLFIGREFFTSRMQHLFRGDTGSFLLGILVGEKAGMSDALVENFQRTGLTHILALSGYNVSILLGVILVLVGRSRKAIFFSLFGLAMFVLFVGPSASVVRAALMGGFLLLGQGLGRPQQAIRACLITAAAMLLIAPWSLRYDIGFDLSFLATLGILRFEPSIRAYLGWFPPVVKEVTSATVAATLLTLPLVAYTFGTVSLVAPLANVLAVPTIPWLMLAGFSTFCISIVSLPAGESLAGALTFGVDRLLGGIGYLAHLPYAATAFQPHDARLALVLAALSSGICVWLFARRTDLSARTPLASRKESYQQEAG